MSNKSRVFFCEECNKLFSSKVYVRSYPANLSECNKCEQLVPEADKEYKYG